MLCIVYVHVYLHERGKRIERKSTVCENCGVRVIVQCVTEITISLLFVGQFHCRG